MNWLQRYRLRHYVRNSIWIVPVLAMGAGMIAVRVLHYVDASLGLETSLNPETTRTVLGTLAGAIFTFIVFICSSLLLVVQLASAQLTPRVIGTFFRDPVTKITLAIFMFTFTFALASLVRVGNTVPVLTAYVAAYGGGASLCIFLYLIDHIGHMLRPSGAFLSVARDGHRVIDTVYPRRWTDPGATAVRTAEVADGRPPRTVRSTGGGVVLALDVQGLVTLGARHDCVIDLVPQVGDFVAPGSALFRVHGGPELPDDALCRAVALGYERTMEQDPRFAFRVIVDIASKGLSPAINDPTTAVLAIDRIHHLLRHVGGRRLDDERVRDRTGKVRLLYRTPDWEDFVSLAVTEIRHFGGTSIQVARRLRAMLEDLIETLPEQRAGPLRQELNLLKKSAQRFFQDPEDQARADISDAQGMGGSQEPRRSQTAPVPPPVAETETPIPGRSS